MVVDGTPGPELLHQQLPRSGQPSSHEGSGQGRGRPVGRGPGRGAQHRRHAGAAPGARAPAGRVQGRRGRALRAERLPRQPGGHRAARRQGGRHLLRPAQPRLHHRRRAAEQRQDHRLRALRPGRCWRPRSRSTCPSIAAACCHRRRVQHGRRHRAAGQVDRGRRSLRRADDGRRRARRGRAGPRRPRRRRSLRAAGRASTWRSAR